MRVVGVYCAVPPSVPLRGEDDFAVLALEKERTR
jgi:hypothetical protein